MPYVLASRFRNLGPFFFNPNLEKGTMSGLSHENTLSSRGKPAVSAWPGWPTWCQKARRPVNAWSCESQTTCRGTWVHTCLCPWCICEAGTGLMSDRPATPPPANSPDPPGFLCFLDRFCCSWWSFYACSTRPLSGPSWHIPASSRP